MDFLQILQTSPAWLAGTVFLLGLVVGSFLNVVAHRLPLMMEREWRAQCRELMGNEAGIGTDDDAAPLNLVSPRSRCPHCGHAITALENIPVLSWLWLRGRCSDCGTRISARYPVVELATGVLSAVAAWHFGWGWPLAGALLFTWFLVPLTLIDLDHQLLPDSLTLPLVWIGLLASLVPVFVTPEQAIVGAAAGYLSLWLVYQLFRLVTGKEGMGFGDFKLLAACGAFMGWQMLPVVILLSSLVGAVVGIGLIALRGRDRSVPIPFGPYIAAAGWIALLWGQEIIDAYLRFAGLR
ncbi:prepilin peptidase [Thiohalobacter sp.]|uniref:prepilin peptidase n=1 Tax=Thiohalobacter sp. TaxID=2025948 RepID=UPI00294FFB6F|nr:A24 family peptidase [Thiohalobacter sp.]